MDKLWFCRCFPSRWGSEGVTGALQHSHLLFAGVFSLYVSLDHQAEGDLFG